MGIISKLITEKSFYFFFPETREVHLWGCKRFGQISAKAEGSSRSCLTSSDFGGETVKHLAVGWTHNIVLTGRRT